MFYHQLVKKLHHCEETVADERGELCFLFLEHVFLLDPGIDQSVQLQKARYVFTGS